MVQPDGRSDRPAGLVDRRGLWSEEQRAAAREIVKRVERDGLQLVRLSFADQHGILRGKTLIAAEIGSAFGNGCAIPATLLAKDTSHRTAVATFRGDGDFGIPGVGGAGDLVMVPDPTTFRVLPWSPGTGWMLCDLYESGGSPLAFSSRHILRQALGQLAGAGYGMVAGLEIEFHIFRLEDGKLRPEQATQPGAAPDVSLLSQGFQYLTETRLDQVDETICLLAGTARALDLPLMSLEGEFGPSQFEATFKPMEASRAADAMMLFRSAVKQVCHRAGLHATFMCRPHLPNLLASGWHLHQSLCRIGTGVNAFMPTEEGEVLSPVGRNVAAGLLAFAAGSCVFSTPTINGYKRYRAHSMAPDRATWGRDNKGAMIRVINNGVGDPATRLENRIGEPAANPYLYLASQALCALEGIEGQLEPPPASDTPYDAPATLLPTSLIQAMEALRGSQMYRARLGSAFVDYLLTIKQAEIARFLAEVTDWEQREYFSLF